MTKLAQGRLDLHSKRGETDFAGLAALALEHGATGAQTGQIAAANTVLEAFSIFPLGNAVAAAAWETAAVALRPAECELDIVVFDRAGTLAGRTEFAPLHASPRNRRR